ncbi:MAG TPA: dipeptidase, partial [Firmicutes bacterium]|nr:dipeptidase [Bacillota bacterium]
MNRKRLWALVLSLSMVCAVLSSGIAFACTDIVVGKDASTDGATITSHTCDEGGYGGLGSGVGYDAR